MTGEKYIPRVYGTGRIYDPELDAWREPMTEAELERGRQYSELLKKSFAEVGKCRTEPESE